MTETVICKRDLAVHVRDDHDGSRCNVPVPMAAPQRHLAYIDHAGRHFFLAGCSTCGWAGPARRIERLAEADRDAHLVETVVIERQIPPTA